MAEILKGKRSTSRRSSILKRALVDIDVNVTEKTETTRSKRVSFAETCCIKEFPRDSPHVLKAAEHNESADTSADGSLQGADTSLNSSNPPRPEVDQPPVDNPAGSSFMLEDGETIFVSDVAKHDGFCESTRRFDRLDNCLFVEAGMLDVSEIAQGDNSVFDSASRSTRTTGMAASTSVLPSANQHLGGSSNLIQVQLQPVERTSPVKHSTLKRTQGLSFPHNEDRTLMFDDQDGGTMDLTLMDTSRRDLTFQQHSPKFSARDFLSRMKGPKGVQGPTERREERTMLFSDTGMDGYGMELTQNLTEHNFTQDFKNRPEQFNPLANEDVFVTGGAEDENVPKVSAKSFLASLRPNFGSVPATTSASVSTVLSRSGVQGSLLVAGEHEQAEDGDMTMELTCHDPMGKPITQTLSTSKTVEPIQPVTQRCQPQQAVNSTENNEEDVTEMELTSCVDIAVKPSVGASSLTIPPASQDAREANLSAIQTRNALMDITAQYSVSPPPQPAPLTSQTNSSVCISNGRGPLSSQGSFSDTVHSAAGGDVEITTYVVGSIHDQSVKSNQGNACQSPEKSIVFNAENTAANMSLTCSTLPHVVPQKRSSNRTVMFDKEDTVGNMSLTCAISEPSAPVNKSRSHKTILLGEETTANMSLTCTSFPSKQAVNKSLTNESVLCRTEGTVADMSLTCAHLQPSDKNSILFKADNTAANMSLTFADLSQMQPQNADIQATVLSSAEKQQQSLKSIVFAREATAANMSLTCTDLLSPRSTEQGEASCSEKNQTYVHRSNRGDVTQNRSTVLTDKHQPWEKSIVFSKEATAANMSLTCADLPAVEDIDQKAAPCSERTQTITFKSTVPAEKRRPSEQRDTFSNQATEGNTNLAHTNLPEIQIQGNKQSVLSQENQAEKQDQKTLHFYQSMSMTCMSPEAKTEGEMDKLVQQEEPVIPSYDDILTKPNQTQPLPSVDLTADAQRSGASAYSNGEPAHSQECFKQEAEEEDDDVFMKREPTTLMDITSVLHNMKKQFEKGKSLEETGAVQDNKMSLNSSPTEQPKPERANTVSSRALQLSSTQVTNKAAGMPDSNTETSENRGRSCGSLKRPLQTVTTAGHEPVLKAVCLSAQTASDLMNVSSDIFKEPATRAQKAEDSVDSLSTASRSKESTDTSPASVLSQSSSSSSQSGRFVDIFSETMPVFGLAASNTSAASVSAMSTSAINNITGSFLSLGRSFVEKQVKAGGERSSFLQTCEQLGITMSDLKGWVCRRSSGAVRPDVSCDTMEDQLNLASVVKPECESKVEFVTFMDTMHQREEASSEELETIVMRQISQLGLVAESEQCPPVRQQIRGLLFASRKHAQVVWKTHKAERLNQLVQKMEAHNKAVSADVENMTTSIEHMATMKEKVDNSNSQLQSQLRSLRDQLSSKKRAKPNAKQQALQQQHAELRSLQEQVSEAKCLVARLAQKEGELTAEQERAKQRCEMNVEREKQLAQAHNALSSLHCLHCWRQVRVEEQQVDFLLLYDAVLLSVGLSGSSAPCQPLTSITATSRLAEGAEPWALLSTQLVVDCLSSNCQQLMDSCPSRQHLPLLLDQVTGLVEDVKDLCQQVKMACLRHHITIKGKQISARLWSTERLRKVSLTTHIPVSGYPGNPLPWSTHVIMGDTGEDQLQAAISEAGGGPKQFTRVLQAVLTLLHQ